jgi:hypothetical protein
MAAVLKTHRPSGRAPWPLILLTGETGSGRSWRSAEFTGSDKIGRALWLDLGETCGEEYGVVPGADYEVIEHDGTWVDILAQIEAAKEAAAEHASAGKPPVLLVIDSMTHEWAGLSTWTDKRARRQRGNKRKLAEDPDAEIDITMNLWNDANSRHNRLMNILKTFPGIVIMIADEKEVSQLDRAGNPIQGAKEWKPEGHKFLGRDSSVWIRLFREDAPQVVKCRSVHYGIRPGVDKPKKVPDFTFEWLVFDLLKCDPKTTTARSDGTLDADQELPEEREAPETQESTKPRPAENSEQAIRQAAEYILNAKDVDAAKVRSGWINSRDIRGVEIGALLTESDAEILGVVDGKCEKKPLTLLLLAEVVVKYCEKHGTGPRAPHEEKTAA